ENFDAAKARERRIRNTVGVGDVGKVADPKGGYPHVSMYQRDRRDLDAIDHEWRVFKDMLAKARDAFVLVIAVKEVVVTQLERGHSLGKRVERKVFAASFGQKPGADHVPALPKAGAEVVH